MNYKTVLIICVLTGTFLAGCKKDSIEQNKTDTGSDTINYINTNPLIKNIADPYISKSSDGMFYSYGTTDPETGFRVYVSSDLKTWENKGLVYKSSRKWQSGDFWAPEVYEYNGKYYLFYTAREKATKSLKIGVAVSDTPDGEFIDIIDTPVFDFGYAMIDANILFDDDGRIYLYYSKDCSENIVNGYNTSQIYCVELRDDLLDVIGEPVMISTPDNESETATGQYRWNEAPFVIKNDGRYYLMYSGGYYAEASYHVSYSVSDSPDGPFVKSEKNPILKSSPENNFSGPGHNSVFYDNDVMYIAYHTHMYSNGGGNRQLNINYMNIDKDGNIEILLPLTD